MKLLALVLGIARASAAGAAGPGEDRTNADAHLSLPSYLLRGRALAEGPVPTYAPTLVSEAPTGITYSPTPLCAGGAPGSLGVVGISAADAAANVAVFLDAAAALAGTDPCDASLVELKTGAGATVQAGPICNCADGTRRLADAEPRRLQTADEIVAVLATGPASDFAAAIADASCSAIKAAIDAAAALEGVAALFEAVESSKPECLAGNCRLAVPADADPDAGFAWVQTGAVTQLWTTASHPRDMVTGDSGEKQVVNGAFYTPFCLGDRYTMNIGCAVQCVDGEIDYDTYCPVAPKDVCVHYTATEMYQDCQLDWDSDDEFGDSGKSLKAMWADVLATWYTNLDDLFTTPAMSTTPHYQYGITFDRKMILPHGTANLIGLGFAMNIGISSWYYTGGYRNLTAEEFNLGVYTPMGQPNYEFTSDPFGSTTDGDVFFPDVFGVTPLEGCNLFGDLTFNTSDGAVADGACIYHTTQYPAELGLKPTQVGVVALPYHPCDKDGDPVFMGLPKSCFHIHQSGPHMANGQMMPFYKPLKSGKLDFFGVCSAEELTAQEYLSDLLLQRTPEADGYDPDAQTSGPAAEGAGGLQLPHGRTWGFHLCLDWADIYHPYPCMLGNSMAEWNGNGDLSDFMVLDPLSFVYNPVKYEDEVCAAHEAGDCDWYNFMSLPISVSGVPAGDGSITQQDYPIDSPTTWVDYSTV